MDAPFQLTNHCFLVAVEVQNWARSRGWKSRILAVRVLGSRTTHAEVVICYEGLLRAYDVDHGTATLRPGLHLSDDPLKIAHAIYGKPRKKGRAKARRFLAKWRTKIV